MFNCEQKPVPSQIEEIVSQQPFGHVFETMAPDGSGRIVKAIQFNQTKRLPKIWVIGENGETPLEITTVETFYGEKVESVPRSVSR